MNIDTKFNDFQIFNKWETEKNGLVFENGRPMWLIDQTTGRKYLNESKTVIRAKCLLLTIGTPFIHLIVAIKNIAQRTLNVTNTSRRFVAYRNTQGVTFNAWLDYSKGDLIRIAAQPIAYIGLEIAAIYGLIRPYDGRKLYATIERAEYEKHILAPCFQPSPVKHLFWGKINQQNAF